MLRAVQIAQATALTKKMHIKIDWEDSASQDIRPISPGSDLGALLNFEFLLRPSNLTESLNIIKFKRKCKYYALAIESTTDLSFPQSPSIMSFQPQLSVCTDKFQSHSDFTGYVTRAKRAASSRSILQRGRHLRCRRGGTMRHLSLDPLSETRSFCPRSTGTSR